MWTEKMPSLGAVENSGHSTGDDWTWARFHFNEPQFLLSLKWGKQMVIKFLWTLKIKSTIIDWHWFDLLSSSKKKMFCLGRSLAGGVVEKNTWNYYLVAAILQFEL